MNSGAVRISVVAAGMLTALALVLFGPAEPDGGNRGTPQHGDERASERGSLIHAADGDTVAIKLDSGPTEEVRLIGIDTPETVRPDTPVQCGGEVASRAMAAHTGERVRLQPDATQADRDRYGRLLRYVSTQGGEDLGRDQLEAGLAEVYVYDRPFTRLSSYQAAENQARQDGRGAWSACAGDFHRPLPIGG
jgi:micrococcal nuclease